MKAISIITIFIFYFQISYWPTIKGKWYFFHENDLTQIDKFTRIGTFRTNAAMNFISKDSCEINTIRYDDVHILVKYKWAIHGDTLSIFRPKDTLQEKIISISNDELYLKH